MAISEMYSGQIEQLNDRGIKIEGQWLNWSKFGEAPDPFLAVGMPVRITASDTGWIKRVEIPGTSNGKMAKAPQPVIPDRDERKVTQTELIARQSMTKAACMFYAGQQVDVRAITDLADRLVKHVLRGV